MTIKKPLKLAEMSWSEFDLLVSSGIRTAILPTGAIEQHGYHLPLSTDIAAAQAVAEIVAVRLRAILLPPMPFGSSAMHMKFSGTVSLEHETLRLVARDICMSLAKHGIRRIAIINGNGGNEPALIVAAREVKDSTGAIVTVSSYYHSLVNDYQKYVNKKMSFREFWAHGGIMESAIMMHELPGFVRLGEAIVSPSTKVELLEDPIVRYPSNAEELARSGSYGDPRTATAKIGKVMIQDAASVLAKRLALVWKEIESDADAKPTLPGNGELGET